MSKQFKYSDGPEKWLTKSDTTLQNRLAQSICYIFSVADFLVFLIFMKGEQWSQH